MPAGAAGYSVRELRHQDFASCRARGVSDAGIVLGAGSAPGRPADEEVWTCPVNGELRSCGFLGNPGGINGVGEMTAKAKMSDESEHAVLWRGQDPIDLGTFRGRDSGGVAINAGSAVVGWLCIDPVNRGQTNFRPAAWLLDQRKVLEDFGCDWGQAVDVNKAGMALIVGYLGMQPRAILWNPWAGMYEVIGGMAGVYPLVITAGGVILGTGRDRDRKQVACLARPGQRWEQLGTPPGFLATAMNDAGQVVGSVVRDGFEQPWLRHASGEMVWLPYFDQHGCRPSAINGSGVIVGTASTDHGSHSLVWTP
jgi:hypothetical protein